MVLLTQSTPLLVDSSEVLFTSNQTYVFVGVPPCKLWLESHLSSVTLSLSFPVKLAASLMLTALLDAEYVIPMGTAMQMTTTSKAVRTRKTSAVGLNFMVSLT